MNRAGPAAPALVGLLAGLLLFLRARQGLIDDAYITLDYARTLALHGQWAIQPGPVANTATSPLNVLLLALLTLVFRDPFVAVALVLMASLALTGLALGALSRSFGWSPVPACVGVLLLAVNPLLASTVGMETYLAIGLLAAYGWAAVTGRALPAGLLLGLLVLTRPDLGVVALTALCVPALLRRLHLVALGVLVVTVPWFLVSWFRLASALPDTMLLKIGDRWGPWSFDNGLLLYHGAYPTAVTWAVVPAAVGLVAALGLLFTRFRLVALVVGLGALLHAGVFVTIGTAPYHWYYGPALGGLTLVAALSLGALPGLARAVGVLAGVVAVVGAGWFLGTRDWTMAPITTNWATAAQYEAAAALAPAGSVVRSSGEVGTLAYYCDCTVVDNLSDRAAITGFLGHRESTAGPLLRRFLELNYAHLDAGTPLQPVWAWVHTPDGTAPPAGPSVPTTSTWVPPGRLTLTPAPPVP